MHLHKLTYSHTKVVCFNDFFKEDYLMSLVKTGYVNC